MKKNKALMVLFLFNSIFVFAGSILGPLYSIYVEKVTHSIVTVSISWAVFMFVATIGTFLVANFGDSIKEKEYLLLGGYLFRAIGWFGYIFVSTLPHILLVQLCLGLGEAIGTPAFDVIFAEHVDKGKHVREYSFWKVFNNLFAACGAIAGGWIVAQFGFPVLFVIMGSLALVSFFGILVKPRNLL